MLFLLEIPAVKNLVHQEVTAGKSNELIRLALVNNNRSAIDLLIAIPAVHDLAAENNYYHDELRGAIDLRALAGDRESSMTALSQGEQERLKQVSDRYDTQLKHLSVPGVMAELRAQLKTRYDANPAFIMTLDSNTGLLSKTVLPMDWKAFRELNLSHDNQEKALKAYYQHTDHSAWRYLLKPNPWMHEHAHYVYSNPDNEHERWAAFEEYQSLISLLYLAAKDTETPATDGYTIATRVEQFIKELALIARAHNWDKQRNKILEGVPLLDDDDQPIMEEYDDLEADCPSCYSGIKRRLFQAVQGHPLLVFLTADKINAEIYEFARKYFSTVINDRNRGDFKSAWNKVILGEELKDKDWRVLKSADFSPLKQKEFIQVLTDKYGKQFADDPYFPKKVTQAFLLNSPSDAHLLKFGYTHPEQFFDEPKVKGPGFFESSSKVAEESEASVAIIKLKQS